MNQYVQLKRNRVGEQPDIRKNLSLFLEKLKRGEIDPRVWMKYFPRYPSKVSFCCENCAAFTCCPYDHDMEPLECFSRAERHCLDES